MIMDMTSKDKTTITFTEVDELDNPTSTYIYSASSQEASAQTTLPQSHVRAHISDTKPKSEQLCK